MTSALINKMFRSRTKQFLKNIVLPKQDLTFRQLKMYYMENGFDVEKILKDNLIFILLIICLIISRIFLLIITKSQ